MSDGALDDSPTALPRVVSVAEVTPSLRWTHLHKTLAKLGDEALSVAGFMAAVVGLLTPPVVLFFSGLWNTVAYFTSVWTLWHEITAWRIADMLAALVAVDTASRFALAGGSYFALVFSFMVLCAGLLGRSWRRIFVVPGVLLCAPSVVIFTFAATLSFTVLAARMHLPSWLQYPLIGYALLDALLLAALLLDLRPSSHRARRAHRSAHRRGVTESADMLSAPLPVVRFGPSQLLSELNPVDAMTQPAAILPISQTPIEAEEAAASTISDEPAGITDAVQDETQNKPEVEEVAELAEPAVDAEAPIEARVVADTAEDIENVEMAEAPVEAEAVIATS